MAKSATQGVELEPIDRLEEKLKQLVRVVERLKTEQARSSEENKALKAEVDTLRSQLASSETQSSEIKALREERDVIRGRVGEMLEQLSALDI